MRFYRNWQEEAEDQFSEFVHKVLFIVVGLPLLLFGLSMCGADDGSNMSEPTPEQIERQRAAGLDVPTPPQRAYTAPAPATQSFFTETLQEEPYDDLGQTWDN